MRSKRVRDPKKIFKIWITIEWSEEEEEEDETSWHNNEMNKYKYRFSEEKIHLN